MNKVLFICGKNSGRSQMAEAYLNQLGGSDYEVKSAGLEPAESVNPLVVAVMKEEGIDLAHKTPRSVFEIFKSGELFSHVVTVCDSETDAKCPVFPGIAHRLNWPFPDPEYVTGSDGEKLDQVRAIRDRIKASIIEFIA